MVQHGQTDLVLSKFHSGSSDESDGLPSATEARHGLRSGLNSTQGNNTRHFCIGFHIPSVPRSQKLLRKQGEPLESVPHKLSFVSSSRGRLSTPHGRCWLAENQPWIFPFAARCVSLLDASVRHQVRTFRPITTQFGCVGPPSFDQCTPVCRD